MVVLAAVICGCAENPPRTLHYKAFDIVIASEFQVQSLCKSTLTDAGGFITPEIKILGCFDSSGAQPRIILDQRHPEVLTHELAHWDGRADPERDGYNW